MLQRMVALFVPQQAVPADAQLDCRRRDAVDSRDAHDHSAIRTMSSICFCTGRSILSSVSQQSRVERSSHSSRVGTLEEIYLR